MISGLTVTIIKGLSYSAMAGIVGGAALLSLRFVWGITVSKSRNVDYRHQFCHHRPTDSILRRPGSKSSEQQNNIGRKFIMSVTTETSYLYGWEHPHKMRGF